MTETTYDADDILADAMPRHQRVKELLLDAVHLLIDEQGTMRTRAQTISYLATSLDIDNAMAADLLRELVGDLVDPVIQVPNGSQRFVGVAEYVAFEGAYGYTDYHDHRGEQKRVVCAHCVREHDSVTDIAHATAGDPAGSFGRDAGFETLYDGIRTHIIDAHDAEPAGVAVGATLVSGTTIGGNESFHAGNDGAGSGLRAETAIQADQATQADAANNADTVGGREIYVQSTEPSNPSTDDLWVQK
jgi:hypothetical protein